MPTAKIEAVIFDMDGTLIDSEPFWHQAEISAFSKVGITLSIADCLETVGIRIDRVVEIWREKFPWEGKTNEQVAAEIIDAMQKLIAEEKPLKEGAIAVLEFFKDLDFPMALASASPQRLIDGNIDALGLTKYFKVQHSAEHEKAGKPDPAVFLTTAKLLQVDPKNCVVFEDSLAGIRGAKAAGMVCVAVKEAATPFHEAQKLADYSLESLAEFRQSELYAQIISKS